GVLGPNGAGKTTSLRMILGIIDPDEGTRTVLGNPRPLEVAHAIGYLPEERGLYQSMAVREMIAFMGALRGLPLDQGRRRADKLLTEYDLGDVGRKQIRTLSKGMAQTVQLLGTLVHDPKLIVLDEPFSGLDAINQGRLETLIRARRDAGATILFSTHVIAHAERLCSEISIIAGGKVRYAGSVDAARDRLPSRVVLRTRAKEGAWRADLPPDTTPVDGNWHFALPSTGIESVLQALITHGAGIENLTVERPGLHDAFIAIAGADAEAAMNMASAGDMA
ncbi:MAG: ATP-binding cassette domain-containing protein, partial [Alphaproteobacteria bacterium]|nr:ATP-binding cassette domain-containing protein [Alphaproteobacteria bacterium]